VREILPAAILRNFALFDFMELRRDAKVSQWGRAGRRPSGAALKLLHVVKRSGIGVFH
jgi:hypothetical protein